MAFLIPNATLDFDCETLAERTAATIEAAQRQAAVEVTELVGRLDGGEPQA